MKKIILIVSSLVMLILIIINCGGAKKILTANINEYVPAPDAAVSQTKSNVTIKVEPLIPSKMYDYPELFSFDYNKLDKAFRGFNTDSYFPEDFRGMRWCYTFGAGKNVLAAFKVRIENKTPHILRMKDARIYLIIDGEEPIKAVTKLGNPNLVNINDKGDVLPQSALNQDESLVHWITYFELKHQNESNKGFLSLAYPIGIASQVILQNIRNYKLINDVNKEILPDFSYEGILLFPVIVSWEKVKLAFYDITTKTDAAGNPIEKTKFEFPFVIKSVNMWFDEADKRWKVGVPPVTNINSK